MFWLHIKISIKSHYATLNNEYIIYNALSSYSPNESFFLLQKQSLVVSYFLKGKGRLVYKFLFTHVAILETFVHAILLLQSLMMLRKGIYGSPKIVKKRQMSEHIILFLVNGRYKAAFHQEISGHFYGRTLGQCDYFEFEFIIGFFFLF